jgi:hypothetical protein
MSTSDDNESEVAYVRAVMENLPTLAKSSALEAEKPLWTVWAILRGRGRDRGASLGQ